MGAAGPCRPLVAGTANDLGQGRRRRVGAWSTQHHTSGGSGVLMGGFTDISVTDVGGFAPGSTARASGPVVEQHQSTQFVGFLPTAIRCASSLPTLCRRWTRFSPRGLLHSHPHTGSAACCSASGSAFSRPTRQLPVGLWTTQRTVHCSSCWTARKLPLRSSAGRSLGCSSTRGSWSRELPPNSVHSGASRASPSTPVHTSKHLRLLVYSL